MPYNLQHSARVNGGIFRSRSDNIRVDVSPKMSNFIKSWKNVSCEYDRVNGWNSTLQAAWYITHVRIIWFLWTKRTMWLLVLSFTQNTVRACSVFYPYEGYRSVTPLDAARVQFMGTEREYFSGSTRGSSTLTFLSGIMEGLWIKLATQNPCFAGFALHY